MNKGLLSTYFLYNVAQHYSKSPIQHHNNNVVIADFAMKTKALREYKLYLNLVLTPALIQNIKILHTYF